MAKLVEVTVVIPHLGKTEEILTPVAEFKKLARKFKIRNLLKSIKGRG